ncbi:MAG: DUF6496 domain-containing protein [Bacteroidia bacterium]|nr:DUF6496 domain-containing protein [Bacteroidia bacterium]
MDGFKNSTKTRYDTMSGKTFANGGMIVSRNDMPDGQGPMNKPAMVAKYAKGGSVKKGEQKIGRVMREFTEGKLHSGSKEGPKVKTTKQAVAIALNEARAAGAKIPMKKARGGSAEADDVMMARMSKEEMAMGAKGLKMAQERMARDRTRGVGAMSDKETRILRKEAIKPMSVKKGVPAAKREPMFGPAKRLSIPLKNGGLATMPKKGC